jgi:hypothetical protein
MIQMMQTAIRFPNFPIHGTRNLFADFNEKDFHNPKFSFCKGILELNDAMQ